MKKLLVLIFFTLSLNCFAGSWIYSSVSGAPINNTTAVTIAPAQGAGIFTYLYSLQITNTSTVGTLVSVKAGATTIWIGHIPAGTASVPQYREWTFAAPIIGATNTALTINATTNASGLYVSAQGYSTP